MKILKTAVVGLGRVGWRVHVPQVVEHSQMFSLVAVVDVSQERLDEAAHTYGVRGYTDIPTMIEAEHPDLVVIASPTHLHFEHACTAMRMGCDVFLDKPMATDYETACKIAECAKQTRKKLMIYQPRRIDAGHNQLKHLIESGKIGEVFFIGHYGGGYSRRSDWQTFRKFGGGMLNNHGAHFIDAILYITGQKVTRLFCQKHMIATAGDADDVAKVLFRMESGMTVDLDISNASAVSSPLWVINGSCGGIITEKDDHGNMRYRVRYFDPNVLPPITASDALAAADRKYEHDAPIPWIEEVHPVDPGFGMDYYEKVYDYYALDKAPFVPLEQTLYVMELLARCHEDAESGT